MIERRFGDSLEADAEALVNSVNCVGVMGRGIALQFREAFPDNYKQYKLACDQEMLKPGIMLVHDTGRLTNPRYIINFPTKRHWKGNSRIEDITAGLPALVEEVRRRGIRSIAIPPLGCGLGGLDWAEVRPLIARAFSALPDVHVLVYEPGPALAPQLQARSEQKPNMTAGRAALLGLMRRYLAALFDPTISLLEIHKLLYFMQESGEDLRLRYQKHYYGPYADNLRHVLSRIEGHFIGGYGSESERPDTSIELLPQAAEEAEAFLNDHAETRARFERVGQLIEGFETPLGMELLATVHWVNSREGARTVEEAVADTYAWNERKRIFGEEQIRVAWEALERHGWLASQ
jgi:O-acetyl-ADP-ribose deacetylase (regulator of RNase III)